MRPLLQVRDLEVSYGPLKVLHGVSFEVMSGEVVLLIGRNGSGKSTILKTIIGLTPIESGRVLLDGVDISALRPDEKVRHGIALVPQASNQGRGVFQQLSVHENLELGAYCLNSPEAQRRGEARVFQLFPELEKRARTKVGALSGGQQQMVAVSIALMAEPKVLMLDEPTSGLAIGAAQELVGKIREIATTFDVAVLLVEQNIKLAMTIADRVYACREGRIVRHATPEEIMDSATLLSIV